MSESHEFEHGDESARIVDTSYKYDDYYHFFMDEQIKDWIAEHRTDTGDTRGQVLHMHPPPEKEFSEIAHDKAHAKAEEYLQGHYPAYDVDKSLSNRQRVVAVNKKDKVIGLGFRGTQLNNMSDLVADLEIATGRHLHDPSLKEFIKNNINTMAAVGITGALGKILYNTNVKPKRNMLTSLQKILNEVEGLAQEERRLGRRHSGERSERIWVDVPLEERRADVEDKLGKYERQLNWVLNKYGYGELPEGLLGQGDIRTRSGKTRAMDTIDVYMPEIRKSVHHESEREEAYNDIVKTLRESGIVGGLAYESVYLRHPINWAKNAFTDYYGGYLKQYFGREGEFKSMRHWEGTIPQIAKWTGIISPDERQGELHRRFIANDALVDEVKNKYGEDYRIVPIGHSMGSVQSMNVAQKHQLEGIHINAGAFAHDYTIGKKHNKLQTQLQSVHSETGTPDPLGSMWAGSEGGEKAKAWGKVYRTPAPHRWYSKLPLFFGTLSKAAFLDNLGSEWAPPHMGEAGNIVYGKYSETPNAVMNMPGLTAHALKTTWSGLTLSNFVTKGLEAMETHSLSNFFTEGKDKESKLSDYYKTEYLASIEPSDRTETEKILHGERNRQNLQSNVMPRLIHHFGNGIGSGYKKNYPSIYIDRYGNTARFKSKRRKCKKGRGGDKCRRESASQV